MRYFFITLSATLLLFACKQNAIDVPGYTVVKHSEGSGTESFAGGHVLFELDTYDAEGTLLQSMRNAPSQPQVQIPEEETGKYSVFVDLLKQVKAGDSLSLFIPFDSIPQIPKDLPGNEIEYRMMITDVMNAEEYAVHFEAEEEAAKAALVAAQGFSKEMKDEATKYLLQYKKGGQQITTTTNGVKIMMIEEGRGDNATAGSQISVDYVGMLKDGIHFDDSYSRGQPFSFKVGSGQVIPGWDEGCQYLNVGSKALLEIPYALAYGERGAPPSIPAKSDLIFVIAVNAIN